MDKFDNIFESALSECEIVEEAGGLQAGLDRLSKALGNSSLSKGVDTLKMAGGVSPMNKWDAQPDASNVYSLDPRGNSTQVVNDFLQWAKSSPNKDDNTFTNYVNKLVEARQSSWGATPVYLTQFAGQGADYQEQYNNILQIIDSYVTGSGLPSVVNNTPQSKQLQSLIQKQLRSTSTTGEELVGIHEILKEWFKDSGKVYCGTKDQFAKFEKGMTGALSDIAKKTASLMQSPSFNPMAN